MGKIRCSVCDETVEDAGCDLENTTMALLIDVGVDHPQCSRVTEKFGKTNFRICYCCWLMSLGVKPLSEQYPTGATTAKLGSFV